MKDNPSFYDFLKSTFKNVVFDVLLIYCACLYLFAYYFNNNGCTAESLPNNFFNFLMKITNFSFFEKYNAFMSNINCFKGVIAFAILLVIPYTIIMFLLDYQYHINNAAENIKNKKISKVDLACLIAGILNPIAFIYWTPTKYGSTRHGSWPKLKKILFDNMETWFSQANRGIIVGFSLIMLLIVIFSYLICIFKNKTNKGV